MSQLDEGMIESKNTEIFIEYLNNVGCLFRKTHDTCQLNNYGIELLTLCKANNMYLVNGRKGLDKDVGSISYISDYKGQSLVDYLIACPKTFMLIENFQFC